MHFPFFYDNYVQSSNAWVMGSSSSSLFTLNALATRSLELEDDLNLWTPLLEVVLVPVFARNDGLDCCDEVLPEEMLISAISLKLETTSNHFLISSSVQLSRIHCGNVSNTTACNEWWWLVTTKQQIHELLLTWRNMMSLHCVTQINNVACFRSCNKWSSIVGEQICNHWFFLKEWSNIFV